MTTTTKQSVGPAVKVQYLEMVFRGVDCWIPAAGMTEIPFYTRGGRRLLYCFNPATRKHAYLDMATDLILSDQEARETMGE